VIVSQRLEQADASHTRLLAQYAKASFKTADIEGRLATLVRDKPIVELRTEGGELFFVKRSMSDAEFSYKVFRTEVSAIIGDTAIGFCEIKKLANGICMIADAEVEPSYQRHGIATSVYDLITSDMADVGGLLWPVSPKTMSDGEFKVWWRRSPALVFYYPHRDRLGLTPRAEFDELFNETLNSGIWEKGVAYCSALLSRIRRFVGFGSVRR
jgi:hypothetical protein